MNSTTPSSRLIRALNSGNTKYSQHPSTVHVTGIGSLCTADPHQAVDEVFDTFKSIPFCPEVGSHQTPMTTKWIENGFVKFLSFNDEEMITCRPSSTGMKVVLDATEQEIGKRLGRLGLETSPAPPPLQGCTTYKCFLEKLSDHFSGEGTQPLSKSAVKVQVFGPITLSSVVELLQAHQVDEKGKEEEEFTPLPPTLLFDYLTSVVVAQIYDVETCWRESRKNEESKDANVVVEDELTVMVSIDEPCLGLKYIGQQDDPSSCEGRKKEVEVVASFRRCLLERLASSSSSLSTSVFVGVHCCNGFVTFNDLLSPKHGLDFVNVDVAQILDHYGSPVVVTAGEKKSVVQVYIEAGGALGLGLVTTFPLPPFLSTSSSEEGNQQEEAVEWLHSKALTTLETFFEKFLLLENDADHNDQQGTTARGEQERKQQQRKNFLVNHCFVTPCCGTAYHTAASQLAVHTALKLFAASL